MKLEGIKVLDLSQFLPGPMLTMLMADHGADVISVEPPGKGEPCRDIGYRSGAHSVWFRNTHRGKRSVQLNLRDASDREYFMALAAEADVVVEAFRPGAVSRLGVDYEAVSALNPGVVYVSISAFGQTGRYRDLPAHDLAVQAMSGVLGLGVSVDGNPTMPAMPTADITASYNGLVGVLMALLRRTRTGQGDYIDVSMYDSLIAWTPNVSGKVFATGEPHVPREERSWGGNAMYDLYRCSDERWIALGGAEVHFAKALLEGLGRPDLLSYAALPPGPGQDPLRKFLRETFSARTRAEWVEWFDDRNIGFAPVRTLVEGLYDPVNEERHMLWRDADGHQVVGTPVHFRNEPAEIDPRVPTLDEHRGAVFR